MIADDRKARTEKGFDIIYEARDLDLDQRERDGMTQARTDIETTKKRVKGSEAKIDTELEPLIKKNYWCAHGGAWFVPSSMPCEDSM